MAGPVYLLASERSGTNLLRRRLNNFQQTVYGPSPPHILKHLFNCVPFLGPLRDNTNFKNLIGLALELCYDHFSPWHIRLSIDQIFDAYAEAFPDRRSLILLKHIIFSQYALANNFPSYFCKDNNLFNYVYTIAAELPDARFLYLYRDPRDCILSQLKRPSASSSISKLAGQWFAEQTACLEARANPILRDRFISVSYEEMIRDEKKCLGSICDFFNLDTASSENIVDVNAHEGEPIHEWKNLDKQTDPANFGKYKKELSDRQIKKIEAIVWHPMKLLGYAPENSAQPKHSKAMSVLDREIEIVRSGVRAYLAPKLWNEAAGEQRLIIRKIQDLYM